MGHLVFGSRTFATLLSDYNQLKLIMKLNRRWMQINADILHPRLIVVHNLLVQFGVPEKFVETHSIITNLKLKRPASREIPIY